MPHRTLLASALALTLAAPASAMDYSYRLYRNQIVVDAAGRIEPNEVQIYSAWLGAVGPAMGDRPIVAMVFNSPGGNPIGAAALGALIAHFRMHTGVAGGGQCSSACIFAWAAGAAKSAAPDSAIGVHQPELTGSVSPRDAQALIALNQNEILALARLGAPPAVLDAAANTPPASIYWLTPADLAAWNVKVTR